LAPCCVCGDPVSPDRRCRFCDARLHHFCAVDEGLEGHGAFYLCPMCGDDGMSPAISDRIPDATVTIRGDGLAPCCVCGDPVSPDHRCRFCYA
ncbi:MAG: hypothetical protein ACK53Y_05480, partial [bacterium]